MGDHHAAFCRGSRKDNEKSFKGVYEENEVPEFQTTCLIDDKMCVLLQTALCKVIGNNKHVMLVKALFDSCPQQTYIANRLVKALNLKPLREINLTVRTFFSEAKILKGK